MILQLYLGLEGAGERWVEALGDVEQAAPFRIVERVHVGLDDEPLALGRRPAGLRLPRIERPLADVLDGRTEGLDDPLGPFGRNGLGATREVELLPPVPLRFGHRLLEVG